MLPFLRGARVRIWNFQIKSLMREHLPSVIRRSGDTLAVAGCLVNSNSYDTSWTDGESDMLAVSEPCLYRVRQQA